MRISELISISLGGFFSGEHGCYVYVTPADFPFLDAFVKMFPELPATTAADIHCTVMYSPEGCPNKEAAFGLLDDSRQFEATAKKLTFWEGHNSAGYIVLELSSLDLSNRHGSWKGLGAVPTFADYTPHVTLATGLAMTPELAEKLAKFNEYLAEYGSSKKLIFSNEHVEDIEGKS